MVSLYDPIDQAATKLRYGTLIYRMEVRAGKVYRIVEHEPPRQAWTHEDVERESRAVE
mgnify:CR=1 FL=1